MINSPKYIWHNGELIHWDDAKIHIMSGGVMFAASAFEGIRCYSTPKGPAVLHLDAHMRRLHDSCKIYRIDLPYDVEELGKACCETIIANKLSQCYIRPSVIRGYGGMGMDGAGCPTETYIATWEWGSYLGEDAFETGIDICTSSWNRPAPNTSPGAAKVTANYGNASLIKMEAKANGFIEAIALSPNGMVSEGSGQNIFMVLDGTLITPPINGSNLSGITRESIITIARDIGIDVRVEPIPRELLYTCNELFFVGTATEVMPIRSLDHITIGSGTRGPITERLQAIYNDMVSGRVTDKFNWLSFV